MKNQNLAIIIGSQIWLQNLVVQTLKDNQINNVDIWIEHTISNKTLFLELKKRFKKYSLVSFLNQVTLQIYLYLKLFFNKTTKIKSTIKELQIDDFNKSANIKLINSYNYSSILCIATSILKESTLKALQPKCYNLHPGITPRYRGAGGNFWAILEKNFHCVGYTIHLMDKKIDAGEIVVQRKLDISDISSIEELNSKCFSMGIVDFYSNVSNGGSIRLNSKDTDRYYGWYGLTDYLKVNKILNSQAKNKSHVKINT